MLREDLSQVQDSLLTSRAQTGDREAFGELYRRYLPPVLRFLSYRVSSKSDAEDLAGLVFFRAWQALPRYREQEAGFRAWLYRIARNSVIDHYRTSRNHASTTSPGRHRWRRIRGTIRTRCCRQRKSEPG